MNWPFWISVSKVSFLTRCKLMTPYGIGDLGEHCLRFKQGFLHGNGNPCVFYRYLALRWRQNERDVVSKHRRLDWLLNRLFRRRSKKTWKLCVSGLCMGNSSVTGEFPAQKACNAKKLPFDDVILAIPFVTWPSAEHCNEDLDSVWKLPF